MSIANTEAKSIIEEGIIDDNDQTQARVRNLRALEAIVGNSYPNKFERSRVSDAEDTISNLVDFAPVQEIVRELKEQTPEGEKPNPELKESLNARLKEFGNVRVAGRLAVPPRVMGKAAFVHLSDGRARLQIYVRKQDAVAVSNADGAPVAAEGAAWEVFSLLDHGDFLGVEGYLFLTNTGELSVHVETLQFLSKSLLPMPDKMHGISDPELRRRYRYADLIASSLQVEHEGLTTREVFERRARLISGMRNYLDSHGYIEVETPMLTPKATGAAATPFVTHHNALDIRLYARIAPELYLKRLTVGGFEKVYELNRNFRNEGLSHKHNPEFTMLEFYCAYMDVSGMMDFAEAMIKEAVEKATGGNLVVNFDGNVIDFSKFEKLTMKQAIAKYWNRKYPEYSQLDNQFFSVEWLNSPMQVAKLKSFLIHMNLVESDYLQDVNLKQLTYTGAKNELADKVQEARINERDKVWRMIESQDFTNAELTTGKILEELFENIAESNLIQPTFIVDYPKSISPLSKASPANPNVAERFELFINGMEVANGFSELNDPQEQYERFVEQMRERDAGDAEAMVLDEDYIRALSYGMPPAAGIGIGIDRLVMLLTNRHSIRDVILFPHMRPERREEEKARTESEERDEN